MKAPWKEFYERVENSETITPKNKEHLKEFLTYENTACGLFSKWKEPPYIVSGKGNKVYDADGREYIDCLCGMGTMNIGHGDERVANVIKEQYETLSHWFDFPTPQRTRFCRRMTEITPGDFPKRVWLGLSGSDAADAMIRLVRMATGKPQIISFIGGFHGQTSGTMFLTTKANMHTVFTPVPANSGCVTQFPYPYCYRCTYDKKPDSCGMFCVEAIERMLTSNENCVGNVSTGSHTIAAIVLEPMLCSTGYIMPPRGFIKAVRELCDKYRILLVIDEVQTGLGRTGKLWACEHDDVVPDVIMFGKAAGGGMPMSGIVARAELFDGFTPGSVSNTYAGYALGCAAANKVLDILEEDKLVENAARVGEYIAEKMAAYAEKHISVGSYDQIGVFMGLEYVLDREKKTPAAAFMGDLYNALLARGLLCHFGGYYGNRIKLIPPLIITKDDVDEIFDILDAATTEMEEKHNLI